MSSDERIGICKECLNFISRDKIVYAKFGILICEKCYLDKNIDGKEDYQKLTMTEELMEAIREQIQHKDNKNNDFKGII